MQWYFSSILISCVIMNHRYILSAFHPRDFNSFDYGSLFHVQVCFAAQQHYLSKTGVFHDGWCCRNKEVIDHTWALLCKNHCFSLDSILHKQRHDWSHSRTSLQKLWSFVKLDVSKAKRWLIPQQHYLSKTLFFHLARGFLLWVACFASLHISILTSFVIVNHTWYSKCIPSQQIQWFAAFFMTNLLFPLRCWFDDFPIQYRCIAKDFFLESTRLVGVCYELLVWLIYAVVFQ